MLHTKTLVSLHDVNCLFCLILLHYIVRACVGPQSGLLQIISFEAATKGHRQLSAATKDIPVFVCSCLKSVDLAASQNVEQHNLNDVKLLTVQQLGNDC